MHFQSLIPFVAISLSLAANAAPAIDPIYARSRNAVESSHNILGTSPKLDAQVVSDSSSGFSDIYRRRMSKAAKQRKKAAQLAASAKATNSPVNNALHTAGVPGAKLEQHNPTTLNPAGETGKEGEKKVDPAHHTSLPEPLSGSQAEKKPGETPAHPSIPGEQHGTPKTQEEEEKEKEKEAKEKAAHPNEPSPAVSSESTASEEGTSQKPGKMDLAINALGTIKSAADAVSAIGGIANPGAAGAAGATGAAGDELKGGTGGGMSDDGRYK
ncbi:hypothetical protein GGU11DRAFT_748929 [Lentinula aff. detonsa]|nr:hypothetical protein GGU11DRAFT_748929 [Lentinula aff. detonsa]